MPPEFVGIDGQVTLYHYSTEFGNAEEVVIDPEESSKRPRGYSRQEFSVSNTPRTFFYLNIDGKESLINGKLYRAKHPASRIYNLRKDPLDLLTQSKNEYGVRNFSTLFDLLRENGYDGVYYRTSTEVVAMLVPVRAQRITEEEVRKEKAA